MLLKRYMGFTSIPMETKNKTDGSPIPRLEAMGKGTAGTKYERPTIIECPPDAAKHDCAGCVIMDICKLDIRAALARKKVAPIITGS